MGKPAYDTPYAEKFPSDSALRRRLFADDLVAVDWVIGKSPKAECGKGSRN
jgi:hypothetical protein